LSYGGLHIINSKFRGANSKRLNYNKASIKRHLDHIEQKSQQYLKELEIADELEGREELEKKQEILHNRKEQFIELEKELDRSGASQISLVDKDARALREGINSKKIGYNIQSSVDDKHKLIVTVDVTNTTDRYSLHKMSKKSKDAFKLEDHQELLVLADKGYHYGDEMAKCYDDNIETLIDPHLPFNKRIAPAFQSHKFIYDKKKDILICPDKKELTSNNKWYKDLGSTGNPRRYKKYSISGKVCKNCPFYEQCVSLSNRKKNTGRKITRAEFKDAIDRNKKKFDANKEEYKLRQAIVEHPFGTIKRHWGYTHTNMKGKEKVKAEFNLIFLCYNLKRTAKILTVKGIIDEIIRKITSFSSFNFSGLNYSTQMEIAS